MHQFHNHNILFIAYHVPQLNDKNPGFFSHLQVKHFKILAQEAKAKPDAVFAWPWHHGKSNTVGHRRFPWLPVHVLLVQFWNSIFSEKGEVV